MTPEQFAVYNKIRNNLYTLDIVRKELLSKKHILNEEVFNVAYKDIADEIEYLSKKVWVVAFHKEV